MFVKKVGLGILVAAIAANPQSIYRVSGCCNSSKPSANFYWLQNSEGGSNRGILQADTTENQQCTAVQCSAAAAVHCNAVVTAVTVATPQQAVAVAATVANSSFAVVAGCSTRL